MSQSLTVAHFEPLTHDTEGHRMSRSTRGVCACVIEQTAFTKNELPTNSTFHLRVQSVSAPNSLK